MTPRILVLLLLCVASLHSQTTIHASLRGMVLDPQGRAVPGARVGLIEMDTGARLESTSSGDGGFLFSRLRPGHYTISVEKESFRRSERSGVWLAVNDQLSINITLEVGTVSEKVEVQDELSIVQAAGAQVSNVVGEGRIKGLPLNGKNFQRLVSLVPGVGGGNTVNPSVSGARPFTNNYSVDGGSANDDRGQTGMSLGGGGAAEFSGASPNLVSTEAIQEFTMITSNADATFGRGSGGQVNIITKSGSNSLRGSVYEYFRNNKLDARDFFNTGPFFDSQRRSIVPPFRQNLFGAAVGGPIKRNKLFFFGSYEGFRQKLEQTASAIIPNGDLIRLIPGDLGRLYRLFYIDSGVAPATGTPPGASFNPLAAADRNLAIAGGFPAALFDGSAANGEAGTLLLSTANTRNVNQDGLLIRTDHRLNDRWSLGARYAFAQPSAEVNTRAVAGVIQQNLRRWQSAMLQAVYIATPAQILEGRASLLRSRMRDQPRDPILPALIEFGVDPQLGLQSRANGTALSTMTIPGSTGFIDNQTIPQFSLLHTWTRGKLTLRSGFDIRRVNLNVLLISNATFIQYSGFVGRTGLIGASPDQRQTISSEANSTIYGLNGGPTTPLRGWRTTEQEYFSQADWRLSRSITVNAGLRYSNFGVYSEVNGAAGNLYSTDASGAVHPDRHYNASGPYSNAVQGGKPFHQPDRNNFQPRIGVAWNIGGRDTTVVRAAYGLYTDRWMQRLFDFGVLNPPYALSGVFTNIEFPAKAQLPLDASTPPQGRFMDPALRNPNSHRFNAAIERKILRATSVSATYVGMRSTGLYSFEEPNGQAGWPQTLRPDPRFSRYRLATNASDSAYDALQVFARHRMSGSLDFTVSYTWSRAVDNTSLAFADRPVSTQLQQFPTLTNLGGSAAPGFQGGGLNVARRPLLSDKGRSDFDIPRVLIFSHLWEAPFGRGRRWGSGMPRWMDAVLGGYSLAGIVTLRDGEPFTLRSGIDYADIGDQNTLRPALLSGSAEGLYAKGAEGRTQWLVSKAAADRVLGVPANVTDPFAALPRNSHRSPGMAVYDVSVIKAFRVSERWKLGFEANFFNVFNRAQFGEPVFVLTDTRFGRTTSTRPGTNPRQIQLGLKLSF
jgi:hypothetical protein